MRSSVGLAVALLGLVPLPALAQSYQMGLQAGIIQPQSDILKTAVNDKTGLNAGLHLAIHINDHSLLRPRLDYLHFPTRTDHFVGGTTSDYKLSAFSLGADYLHYLKGTKGGFYLLAGLSMNRWKVESEDVSITIIPPSAPIVTRTPADSTSTKMAITAGVGYQFTPSLGAETRYELGRIFNSDAHLIQAGFTFRF